MAFEKERKINYAIIAAGLLLAALGTIMFFTRGGVAWILVLVLGIFLLFAGGSIWSIFYKMDLMEYLRNNKQNK